MTRQVVKYIIVKMHSGYAFSIFSILFVHICFALLKKLYYVLGGLVMNKQELLSAMAEKSGLTKKDSEKALAAFIETVQASLKKGDKVQLIGFGSFEIRKRAAREGVNPLTGKKMSIPAAKVPAFKAGRALKDLVNRK